jgi:hypothetical protein
MGLLWRLFAPKPLKKARRTVSKAAHPARTATRAVTPKAGQAAAARCPPGQPGRAQG